MDIFNSSITFSVSHAEITIEMHMGHVVMGKVRAVPVPATLSVQ